MDRIQDIKHQALAPFEALWRKGKTDNYVLAEGYRLVDLALQSAYEPLICLVSDDFAKKHTERLENIKTSINARCDIYLASDRIMNRLTETKSPQGIVLILKNRSLSDEETIKESMADGNFRCLVLEKVQDPGNVGSIVRTAEAFAYDAVFYTEGCANPLASKALRASMGSAFFIPLIPSTNIEELLRTFKSCKITTIAASLEAESIENLPAFSSCAIMIGNEAEGLSKEVLAKVDKSARIPMSGHADSLNAAAAAAIMAYYFRGS